MFIHKINFFATAYYIVNSLEYLFEGQVCKINIKTEFNKTTIASLLPEYNRRGVFTKATITIGNRSFSFYEEILEKQYTIINGEYYSFKEVVETLESLKIKYSLNDIRDKALMLFVIIILHELGHAIDIIINAKKHTYKTPEQFLKEFKQLNIPLFSERKKKQKQMEEAMDKKYDKLILASDKNDNTLLRLHTERASEYRKLPLENVADTYALILLKKIDFNLIKKVAYETH